MKKDIQKMIEEFVQDELLLKEITKIDNVIKSDYDAKLSVKIGKRIDKNIKAILQSNCGIEEFRKLLKHDNVFIRFIAARYLYPLNPKECEKIMNDYKNTLTDKLEISNTEDIIQGLKSNKKIFMDQFKEIYDSKIF